jgi:transposase
VFYVLEEAFTCLLANAAHIAQVPGRKTDVQDCQWIAQLLEHGLIRGSFVPPAPIRELRDLTRYRKALIQDRTREANRLHKVLQDAGIKLASVATDILGVSGRAMLEALIGGRRTRTCSRTWRAGGCGRSSRRCARRWPAGFGPIMPFSSRSCWPILTTLTSSSPR